MDFLSMCVEAMRCDTKRYRKCINDFCSCHTQIHRTGGGMDQYIFGEGLRYIAVDEKNLHISDEGIDFTIPLGVIVDLNTGEYPSGKVYIMITCLFGGDIMFLL